MIITTDDLQVIGEGSGVVEVQTTGTQPAFKILATRLLIQGMRIRQVVPDESLEEDGLACITIEAGSATVAKYPSPFPPRAPYPQHLPVSSTLRRPFPCLLTPPRESGASE